MCLCGFKFFPNDHTIHDYCCRYCRVTYCDYCQAVSWFRIKDTSHLGLYFRYIFNKYKNFTLLSAYRFQLSLHLIYFHTHTAYSNYININSQLPLYNLLPYICVVRTVMHSFSTLICLLDNDLFIVCILWLVILLQFLALSF